MSIRNDGLTVTEIGPEKHDLAQLTASKTIRNGLNQEQRARQGR
jgi:hypothetical protein